MYMMRLDRVLMLVAVLAAAGGAWAQEPATQTSPAHDLDAQVRAAIDAGGHDAETAALLEQGTVWGQMVDDWRREMAQAAERQARLERQLDELPTSATIEVPADAGETQLQQSLNQAQAQLDRLRSELKSYEAEIALRRRDRQDQPAQLQQAQRKLEEVQAELAQPLGAEPTEDDLARRKALRAQELALRQQLEMLRLQPRYFDATSDLLRTRRDLADRQVALATQQVEQWREALNTFRGRAADQKVQSLLRDLERVEQLGPAAAALARENIELGRQQREITSRIRVASGETAEAGERLRQLEDTVVKLRRRIERVGLTEDLGRQLRRERARLPDLTTLQRQLSARSSLLGKVADQRMELEQRLDSLDEEAIARQARQLAAEAPADRRDAVEVAGRELLQRRREVLADLARLYEDYEGALLSLQEQQQQLVDSAAAFEEYISERILWFRSSEALGPGVLADIPAAAAWLVAPANWREVGLTLWQDMQTQPALWGLMLAVLGVLVWAAIRTRGILEQIGTDISRGMSTRYLPTLRALMLTVVQALPAPLVMWVLAWRLAAPLREGEFQLYLASALGVAAVVLLTLRLLGRLCAEDGLAHRHFRWNSRSLQLVRRDLRWFTPLAVGLTLLAAIMEAQEQPRFNDGLGRLSFILLLVAVAMLTGRLLRPSTGILRDLISRYRGGWLDRLRVLWYPLAAGVGLVLAGLSAAGYHYTAWQLSQRLLESVWLMVTLAVVYGLVVRWLTLARRRLAIDRARKRRTTEETTQMTEEGVELGSVETPEANLLTLSSQMQTLIRTLVTAATAVGLWLIWADVLPAVRALDRVELWQIGDNVINLSSVLWAIVIVVITVVAARNIPGLLEMAVLQNLPLEPSVRFAITAVSRYTIAIVGIVVTFSAIGIGWEKVQWLAAAVTVGLGFGLQEIFANFVSGLIILFERPMRVGDVVTIGEVSGTVTQIRIRATTVTDWSRKELIVPNKEFITGRLINWTLSDKVLRVVLPVGIAYGSDTHLAAKLLRQVAFDDERVLPDPAPLVLFSGFGESSLNFELRVYIGDIVHYIPVASDLHFEIDRVFRENRIEIAFPQRDIHVRSIKAPLSVTQQPAPGSGGQDVPPADSQ
jgi:potassium efflux system protein